MWVRGFYPGSAPAIGDFAVEWRALAANRRGGKNEWRSPHACKVSDPGDPPCLRRRSGPPRAERISISRVAVVRRRPAGTPVLAAHPNQHQERLPTEVGLAVRRGAA